MSKAQLYQKLARAMDKFDPVLKEANNPFFKSKYANLNTILDATVPALRAEGLVMLQPIEGSKVVTMIVDVETGEAIVSFMEIPVSLVDPQKILAATTYFRRGGIQCLLNLQCLDDDGNYASGRVEKLETETKKMPEKGYSTATLTPAPVAGTTGFKRPIGQTKAPAAVISPKEVAKMSTKVWDDA